MINYKFCFKERYLWIIGYIGLVFDNGYNIVMDLFVGILRNNVLYINSIVIEV